MERIRQCNGYQKFILLLLVVMVLGFAVQYTITTSRVGFPYRGAILVPSEENGNTVYAGEINGQPAVFTVAANNTVVFQYGEKTYGPYSVRQEPSLSTTGFYGNGIEVRCAGELIFRGSVRRFNDGLWLTNADGSSYSGNIVITSSNGTIIDKDGKVVDQMKPSVTTVLELLDSPELTHKGHWAIWFCGFLMCATTAVSILFAEELFYWNMAFRVRNVYDTEPSDWVIFSRYVAWTIMPIFALILFAKGLQ